MITRPMLFSAPMVRALLDGTKTQTRRVVKVEALECLSTPVGFSPQFVAEKKNRLCPYGQTGDQLLVRSSRITLEITGVRLERLQDISEADAIAEGVEWFSSGAVECPGMPDNPLDAFSQLWEQINEHGSWAANPWVWVIEFKRLTS